MNKYEFELKVFGNLKLEVMADSRKEAEEMVEDFMNKLNINIKDFEDKENNANGIKINKSELTGNIIDKYKERER